MCVGTLPILVLENEREKNNSIKKQSWIMGEGQVRGKEKTHSRKRKKEGKKLRQPNY